MKLTLSFAAECLSRDASGTVFSASRNDTKILLMSVSCLDKELIRFTDLAELQFEEVLKTLFLGQIQPGLSVNSLLKGANEQRIYFNEFVEFISTNLWKVGVDCRMHVMHHLSSVDNVCISSF